MKVLHLEDNTLDAELVRELLGREWPDCAVSRITTRAEFAEEIARGRHDVIVCDYSLGSFDGLQALSLARERVPDIPFVFYTGTLGEDRAISSLHDGAADYVLKDHPQRLVPAIRRALREAEERRSRQAAERRARELVTLINHAPDAIVMAELDGRVNFWNRGAERYTGRSAAAARGRPLEEVFGPEAAEKIAKAHRAVRESGEWRGEIIARGADGVPLNVEINASLIRGDDGEAKAMLFVGADVTEHRKLEEQFFRSQRLESIGMLAAGIAHDLNNVLAPLLMGAPMLREHVTHPAGLQMLAMFEKSAERGAALVRQILSFAHGVGGEPQQIQVSHLLRDIGVFVRETFPKNIRYEERVPRDLWPAVANPTKIHQVLLNLCVNARDAMPQGGVLRVRAENVVLDEAAAHALEGGRSGAWLTLEIEDTGTGIPSAVLPRIWEPFFTTKGGEKGTGLGLSTVRGIVEAHQGFITVRSEPGHGTAFRVFLPAVTATPGSAPATPAVTAPRGRGELILIVDDELNFRNIASVALDRHGYRVLNARDGTDALALFAPRSDDVALVITDLDMPRLDGAAVAGVVRRLNPAVKILAISGLPASDAPTTAVPDYADAFLPKPFTADTLLVAVDRLLRVAK